MSGLAALLDGARPPGVYRWTGGDEDEVERVATAAGWSVAALEPVSDRSAALTGLGRALAFPPWYGANLDALADCLRDLAAPTLLLWEDPAALADADPAAYDGVVAVLRERAERSPAFAVLLHGAAGDDVAVL